MPNMIAEDIITLDGLSDFLDGCDQRYARDSDVKTYGLSINGHTVSIVEGGQNASVTVPDSDTTYSPLSQAQAENGTSTDAGLVTGQRLKQAIVAFLKTATWNDLT